MLLPMVRLDNAEGLKMMSGAGKHLALEEHRASWKVRHPHLMSAEVPVPCSIPGCIDENMREQAAAVLRQLRMGEAQVVRREAISQAPHQMALATSCREARAERSIAKPHPGRRRCHPYRLRGPRPHLGRVAQSAAGKGARSGQQLRLRHQTHHAALRVRHTRTSGIRTFKTLAVQLHLQR